MPSYYYENSLGGCGAVSSELAYAGSAHGWYETRITTVPWWDTSGGRPVQLALANSGAYLRTAASRSEWNPWQTIITSANIGSYMHNMYDAEIEYIESTGTQWINTNYIPNYNTELTIQFAIKKFNTDLRNASTPFGARMSWGNKQYTLFFPVNNTSQTIACYGNTHYQVTHSVGLNDIYVCNVNKNTWTVTKNSQSLLSYTFDSSQSSNLPNLPLYLFLVNENNQVYINDNQLLIYNCTIKENGQTILDFIPVRVGQVGCLYDKVSGKLFCNAGTGDFLLGQDIGPGGGYISIFDFATSEHNHDDRYRLRNGVYAYYSDGTIRTYKDADTNAMAAVLITDRLSILIDKTDFYGDQLPDYGYSWQVVGGSSPLITDQTTAELDYNGKTNTDKMIADYPNGVGAYVRTRLNGTGYIPALGELKEIYNNTSAVNSMLVKIGGTAYDWNTNQHKCSSTAYSTNCLWTIQWYSGWINNSMNIGSWISHALYYSFRPVAKIPNY